MKSLIKPIVRTIIKKVYRYQAEMKLSQLRKIKETTVARIVNIIDDTLQNNLNSDEKIMVNQIEEKRRKLNRSTEIISIIDFGAGEPNLTRPDGNMQQGVITEIRVGETCQSASKPYFWSLLLFKLIREFKPAKSIELGTAFGISGAYQASAQQLNKSGKFITLEGAESLAFLAEKIFQQLGLKNTSVVKGKFQDNLDKVLTENQPIDYAFIDGHHDENATISYFEKFLPYLSKKSLIVLDDISWSDGMRRAWKNIEKHEAVKISLNLGVLGICVLDENMTETYHFEIPGFYYTPFFWK